MAATLAAHVGVVCREDPVRVTLQEGRRDAQEAPGAGCPLRALGPFAPDSDLRRHGLKIAERGGTNAKRRAVVAVARKLSVLLHRLWLGGEEYEPLYNARRAGGMAA